MPSPTAAADRSLALRESGLLTGLALGVLMLLALLLRLPMGQWQYEGSFRGHQACFFLLSAIQYERLGIAKTLGYPSPAIDGVPLGDDDVAPLADDPATLVYVNHPPTVPLAVWWALRQNDRPSLVVDDDFPVSYLPARDTLRITQIFIVLLHTLGLFAFAWCVGQAGSARRAVLALAILVVTPVAILDAGSLGYENASLPFVYLALGFWVRYASGTRRGDLIAACAALALGTSTTWGPLFLVPAIALESALRKRWSLVRTALLALGPAALAPLLVHVFWARAVGTTHPGPVSHALELVTPLLRHPGAWTAAQGAHAVEHLGLPVALAALAGLVVAVTRFRSLAGPVESLTAGSVRVPLVLLFAASFQLAAFARHSIQDQPVSQLLLAPAAAALGAQFLEALEGDRRLVRRLLATGVLVLGIALPSIALARAQHDAARNDGSREWIGALPASPYGLGAATHETTPPGAVVLVPAGYRELTFAASVIAWRSIVPVESVAEIDALRERFPAVRGRPVYAVVCDFTAPDARFDIPGSNARLVRDLPPSAEQVKPWFGTRVWKLP